MSSIRLRARSAKTLVELGVDMSSVHTRGTLTEGVDLALELTVPR